MRARLNYLVYTGEKPVYVASKGGADAALSISARFEAVECDILDARALDPAPALDKQGFQLEPLPTSVPDFYQFERVKEAYEAEITPLLLRCTGASSALIFDHTLRSDAPEVRGEHATREPATVIHNDYSDASAEKRLRDLVGDAAAEQHLVNRYAIVNVWRSINHPVERAPLACCDASTIAPGDLVASERRAAERVGELELVVNNAAHRWYYFDEMQRDEVLLIKTFDSSVDVARRSVHSAFENPLAGADAPPRESIESRALLFYS